MGNRKTLPLRGLHTPRLLLWQLGFLHRRMHTGGLDPETGDLSSAFLTGQTNRFHTACISRVEEMERRQRKNWQDAGQLLLELSALSRALAQEVPVRRGGETGAQARSRARAERERAERERQYLERVKRLTGLRSGIFAEFRQARTQMEATAELLRSGFTAYGHGLLLQPVYAGQLPVLNGESYLDGYAQAHRETWNAMERYVKEGLE